MLQYTATIESRKTTRGTVSKFYLCRLAAGGRYYQIVAEYKDQDTLEKVVAILNGIDKN